ncbi:MAG: hypothetical protein P1U36_00545 [Legionellaceae bacterium]|nr:hypothetical protein [Legionellaceae bacterium]
MELNEYANSRSKALENNACSTCRAMGLPLCKGHRDSSRPLPSKSTLDTFSESSLWQYIDDTDDIHIYANPLALLSIKLDLGAGSLVFSQRDDLSKNEQKELDKLFKAIEHEVKNLKKQDANYQHEENTLTIRLPTPELFDGFVQRLAEESLLITDLTQKKHQQPKLKIKITKDNQKNLKKLPKLLRSQATSAKSHNQLIQHKRVYHSLTPRLH